MIRESRINECQCREKYHAKNIAISDFHPISSVADKKYTCTLKSIKDRYNDGAHGADHGCDMVDGVGILQMKLTKWKKN